MGQVNIQAIDADVLLVTDDTHIRTPRDMTAEIGLALVQVATATSSVLDDLATEVSRPGAGGG